MECLFCKIANKELASENVYEDSKTLAFLDINPVSPGHTLIVPKKHCENLLDCDFETASELFSSVKIVTEMIQKSLDPKGFNIGINHGKSAGQAIDHLHFHIIPRFENDGGGSMHTIVRNPPKRQTVEEIAVQIRSQTPIEKPQPKKEPKQEPKPEKKAEVSEKDVEEILNSVKREIEQHKRTWQKMRTP